MNGLMRVLLTIFFVSACGLTIAGGDASEGSSDGESETWETTSVSGSGSEYEVEIEIELASDDSSGPRDREWWLDSASARTNARDAYRRQRGQERDALFTT